MLLDQWQQDFLDTEGDKMLCCGRRVGKTMVAGIDAGEWAIKHPGLDVLMIALTERQSYMIFEATFSYLLENHKDKLQLKGKEKPTRTKFELKNGARIWCLPTGLTGAGIRGLTIGRLYEDEASRIPEDVQSAVTPMLLTTGGDTVLLSTPFGKQRRFYNTWINKDGAYSSFKKFKISSWDCMSQRKISDSWTQEQRDKALAYLISEEKRLGKVMYAQEYGGEFMDELRQFFSSALIKDCMTLPRESLPHPSRPSGDNYLGVDIARMGKDDTVLFPLCRVNRECLEQLEDMEITRKTDLMETIHRIRRSDLRNNYRKIYIDDAGLGAGVFDILLEDDQTKRKVVGINNASRSIDKDDRAKRLLKEDLYANLLVLMEQGKIKLFEDNEAAASLSSVQVEYKDDRMLIYGNDTHIAEALIRAAWCIKDKHLNLWIR